MTEAATPARAKRTVTSATVARTEWLAPDMVRLVLTGPELANLPELQHTDHYVKLLFPAPGAAYRWPFDPDELRETLPREQWPVTRAYTIRSFDRETLELTVDFVVHGDEGIAGPWAAAAQPGDAIGFFGPGGAWGPSPVADTFLLVGDAAAIPAIAAALDRLPPHAVAQAFLEVEDATTHVPLPQGDNIAVTWVHHADEPDRPVGDQLAEVVRAAGLPTGEVHAFVHGNAGMVKDLRRWLFVERGLPRDRVSISGYWRSGFTDEGWRSVKKEFTAEMEREEQALQSH
ncbi:siderophore-interacting protein [Knoellia koreensis]|uniref:Siderophore-interacting protein n=1 Tax=Knoellia koreensis TaxID=2730921 RepID=A0A849HAX2_9MICO|nr:siderophore-interacting protein [Knoellia sp. DB2414S]NNM46866.1 siderophore-interacting protein [Knoellia sp. DB2414S]